MDPSGLWFAPPALETPGSAHGTAQCLCWGGFWQISHCAMSLWQVRAVTQT